MEFIPSPSGKAKCGEVGGKADGRKGIKYVLPHRRSSRRLYRSSSIALPPDHDSSSSSSLHRIASIDPSYRGDIIELISSWLPNDSGSRPSLLVEARSQAHRGFPGPIQGHRPSMMHQEGITAFSPSCMPIILPLSLLLAPVLRLTTIAVMGSLRTSTSKCSRLRRRCLPRPEIAVTRPTCTAPYQALHARLLRVRLAGRTRFAMLPMLYQLSRALLD